MILAKVALNTPGINLNGEEDLLLSFSGTRFESKGLEALHGLPRTQDLNNRGLRS